MSGELKAVVIVFLAFFALIYGLVLIDSRQQDSTYPQLGTTESKAACGHQGSGVVKGIIRLAPQDNTLAIFIVQNAAEPNWPIWEVLAPLDKFKPGDEVDVWCIKLQQSYPPAHFSTTLTIRPKGSLPERQSASGKFE